MTVIVALAALGGCAKDGTATTASPAPSSSAAAALADKSPSSSIEAIVRPVLPPAALLQGALSAMQDRASVHIECSVIGAGDDDQASYDVATGLGHVVAASRKVTSQELLVNGVAYITTNSVSLLMGYGISGAEAEKLTGKWLAVHPGDYFQNGYLDYGTAITGMTLGKQADYLQLTGSVKGTGTRTLAGQSVYGISGNAYADPNSTDDSATQTVYVAVSGPLLPVSMSLHARDFTQTCTFSKWDEPLRLTAPTEAVPLSALPEGANYS